MQDKKSPLKGDVYDQLLDEDDLDARSLRKTRLKFIVNKFKLGPKRSAAIDSYLAGLCFHEARVAFVNGLDIACILLALAVVENSLAKQLLAHDVIAAIGRIGLVESLARARERGIISEKQFSAFEELRLLRNLRGHPKDRDHPKGFDQLIFELKKSPDMILEKEAKRAVVILDKYWWTLPFVDVK